MTIPRRHSANGFMLIGVIMFVLALSILGMSLYALSGYESDFYGQSHQENAALYAAQGGMDMARTLLATSPYLLQSTHTLEGVEGVTYAHAYQETGGGNQVSTGPMDFSIDSVTIVVRANVGGQERELQAKYRPAPLNDYYKRLFTIGGDITVLTQHPAYSYPAHTTLIGSVWQDAGYATTWTSNLTWVLPNLSQRQIPLPDAGGFLSDHASGGSSPPGIYPPSPPAAAWWTTMAPPGTLSWYVHPVDPINDPAIPPRLNVLLLGGYAVWMFPRGLRADNWIEVTGAGTLVIVGEGLPSNNNVGIDLHGGISGSPGVNIVLVSDGKVKIEQDNNYNTPTLTSNLSVYAGSLSLLGASDALLLPVQSLIYNPLLMDPAIDYLRSHDALPEPLTTTNNSFAMIHGSWEDHRP